MWGICLIVISGSCWCVWCSLFCWSVGSSLLSGVFLLYFMLSSIVLFLNFIGCFFLLSLILMILSFMVLSIGLLGLSGLSGMLSIGEVLIILFLMFMFGGWM